MNDSLEIRHLTAAIMELTEQIKTLEAERVLLLAYCDEADRLIADKRRED